MVWLVGLAAAVLEHPAYASALAKLALLPPKYADSQPFYTKRNVHGKVEIPQFNSTTHEYEGVPQHAPDPLLAEIIPELRSAAEAGSSAAALTLGDMYTFGNFSVPVNYTAALHYYEQAVSREPNAHAYFMLGFMYATGMFGETSVDHQKSNVYYEFAANNGDTNAILVLANKYYHGIGRPADCAVAQFYYSKLARSAMMHIHNEGEEPILEPVSYNINLADFNGGLYRSKVSESYSTVKTKADTYAGIKNNLHEKSVDSFDSDLADYYFDSIQNYYGGFFVEQNLTRAYEDALACAYLGVRRYTNGDGFPSTTDEQLWSRCLKLLGHMYLRGHGVERNLERSVYWLKMGAFFASDKKDGLDMGLVHQLDPTTNGYMSDRCQSYLQDAVNNGSSVAAYRLAKYLISSGGQPLQTEYTKNSYSFLKFAANRDHYESTFYLADAIESGFAALVGEVYGCMDLVLLYKDFVERSDHFMLPHLKYAFDEFKYGNFKNALLGYLMAAEQGLRHAQVSAAYLLYQVAPLYPKKPKTFNDPGRVEASLMYLELASVQGDIDATILLGDLYSNGIPSVNISADQGLAFAYYSKAALSASAHGCYKLGYMYEYGLGSPNNTVDYYMSKRYYDLSLKYYQESKLWSSKPNTYPVSLALLRLRLKLLFSDDQKHDDPESAGWFSTFKKLEKSQDELEEQEEKMHAKAQAHQEGLDYEDEDEYEIFDYFILAATFAFFIYLGMQRLHIRLRGQREGVDRPAEDENQARNNFQFFFFAI